MKTKSKKPKVTRGQHIVKRQGHSEKYDERKVYASCYSACLGTHLTKTEAEKICEIVTKEVTQWIKAQKEVTSDQIFDKVVDTLKSVHPTVAFMYETHRDIS